MITAITMVMMMIMIMIMLMMMVVMIVMIMMMTIMMMMTITMVMMVMMTMMSMMMMMIMVMMNSKVMPVQARSPRPLLQTIDQSCSIFPLPQLMPQMTALQTPCMIRRSLPVAGALPNRWTATMSILMSPAESGVEAILALGAGVELTEYSAQIN